MSTVVYRRPARRPPPALPKGEILFESPPELPEAGHGSAMGRLVGFLPIMAGGGAMAFMFTSGGVGGPQRVVMSVLIAVSMVGMTISQAVNRKGERKAQVDTARRDYARYLTQLRGRVRTAVTRQRAALEWRYPGPDALAGVALTGRLWERRPADSDFGHARVASGRQRFAIQLVPPETKPVEDLDPVCSGALRRFVRAHNTVPDLPVAVGLGSFARVAYAGDADLVRERFAGAALPPGRLPQPGGPPRRRVRLARPAGRVGVAQVAAARVAPGAAGRGRAAAPGVRVDARARGAAGRRPRPVGPASRPAKGAAASAGPALPHLVIVVDGGRTERSSIIARPPAGVTVIEVGAPPEIGHQPGRLRLSVARRRRRRAAGLGGTGPTR